MIFFPFFYGAGLQGLDALDELLCVLSGGEVGVWTPRGPANVSRVLTAMNDLIHFMEHEILFQINLL